MNNGNKSEKRIIIGLNDDGELILIDGTHLLEAYRQLQKEISENLLDFLSEEVKEKLFSNFM